MFIGLMIIWLNRFKLRLKRPLLATVLLFALFVVGYKGAQTALAVKGQIYQSASKIIVGASVFLVFGLVLLFIYLLINGSKRIIDSKRLLIYTSLTFVILAVKEAIHVNQDINLSILIGLLLALVAVLLLPYRKKTVDLPENIVEKRKALAVIRRDGRYSLAASLASLLIAIILSSAYAFAGRIQNPPPTFIQTTNSGLTLIKGNLSEGFSKYSTVSKGKKIRFLVLNKDGRVHLAAESCKVCGPYGYYMESGTLICSNCNAPIPLESVGQEGGCNPAPIEYKETGDLINISHEQLEKAFKYFK